ncbi:UvrD-helicase domain-containing protein [Xanthomonas sp. LMG 12461]|uniref:UvrD-helicase domain-containing protein n=1 Tax=Xanthomonas sacchari TaxID=56458 RepID=UPI001264DFD5|nr:Fis family transcriptional regulator [Xanthomonas sp. LMG 12461]
MNQAAPAVLDDDVDRLVDEQIAVCLDPSNPKSFFLFAGAGSGKTRSLVSALEYIQGTWGDRLRRSGQRVGVITFTNAASDEIKRRIRFDPLFDVRTIHSFAWSLIEGLNNDIRAWLTTKLTEDIRDLQAQEAKGRAGKASTERKLKIASSVKRLEMLPSITRFIYSPTGTNRTRDSLNHAEVIQLTSYLLSSKPRMQSIFVGRYPILLVDESQDTSEALVNALFQVEARQAGSFSLGLIGDMMQRIYSDGKDDLGKNLPDGWQTPSKKMNHRCPSRIVALINKVRSSVDDHQQQPRSDAAEGVVRLFVIPAESGNKPELEARMVKIMADTTGDAYWTVPSAVKTLTLEHKMAAARLGCLDVFSALYELDSMSLLNGTQPLATFFTNEILSIVEARQSGDGFALMRTLKAHSPLLTSEALRASPGRAHLVAIQAFVDDLLSLWKNGADPSLLQVLRRVASSRLLEVPERLLAWTVDDVEPRAADEAVDEATQKRHEIIDRLLAASFSQVEPLREYLAGRARFDTHQGVKGLEFDRVMVIMDDTEARGFMFKYEDLFGGKTEGKVLEATRRLFYVTTSRAKKSLALVAYSSNPERVKRFVLDQGWFSEDEVIEELLN